MKILILGGYGVFGGRLAELLADLPDLELLICGRDLTRAEAFCARFRGKPRAIPCAFDRRDIADTLQRFAPDLVVDASGPFQDYGTNRYHVVEACIAAGIDRSEEHTSELQSLMRLSYAVFCLKNKHTQ